MTDAVIRPVVVTLTALAMLAVLVDAPAAGRVPVVVLFALMAPGLATTRFIPTLTTFDRLAIAGAASLALNIVASLALVAVERWNGEPVLAALAAYTLLLSFLPTGAPWRRRRAERQNRHNRELLERKRVQARAYELVMSADADRRREGLIALSWLLEDEGRRDEAARLRRLARLETPPLLPLRSSEPAPDFALRDAHARARSQDPETRRRGMLEVAELLDATDHGIEADTLRGLALSDDPDGADTIDRLWRPTRRPR